ncbi:hypothetical protein [Moraxella nasicaprae]|uniref:Cell division protein FtsL n=1 Tax=Moraxella nasicaprae TaxID=2904122 RepID=A0ABY6F5D8_9GAMM|nr:hypothetical protein [Moraxella nasicaprae]UXZ05319.1 hypothetical protein LU297_02380 [Moraxella nasicaprae]
MTAQNLNTRKGVSWLYVIVATLSILVVCLIYWNYSLTRQLVIAEDQIEMNRLQQRITQLEQNYELNQLAKTQDQLKQQLLAQDNR